MGLAELRFGIARLDEPRRRAELSDWPDLRLRPLLAQRILEVTEDVMFRWRLLVEEGRKAGHTSSQPDLIIAATAPPHGPTVVTRDTADFRRAAVPLLDPGRGGPDGALPLARCGVTAPVATPPPPAAG